MISEKLLFFILLFSLFLELTIIPFPITFLIVLLLYLLYPKTQNIIVAIIIGVILDILTVRTIGQAPLFILASFLIIDLYRKAFEIKDPQVLLVILGIATYIFAKVFSYSSSILIFIMIFGTLGLIVYYFSGNKKVWFR